MNARQFLRVVHEDVREALVQALAYSVEVRDELRRVVQQSRVVDARALAQTLAVGDKEPHQVGPRRPHLDKAIQVRRLEHPLFRSNAEVDDLVDEPPVPEQGPVLLGPVDLVLVGELVSNVAPLLGAGEQNRRLGVTQQVVVAADEVVGEPVPGVDGHCNQRLEVLVQEKAAGYAVLESDLLCPVRDEEEDAVGRATGLEGQPDEALLEHGRLACPRPPQHTHRAGPVINSASLPRVQVLESDLRGCHRAST